MRDKAERFLKSACKCNGDCNINYKPYEYGNQIESIPFHKAVERFLRDYEEMRTFFSAYGITEEEKVFDGTCDIWKKHIVVLPNKV